MKSPSRVAALNLGMQTATMAVFEPTSDGGITLAGFAQAAAPNSDDTGKVAQTVQDRMR